MEAVNYYHKALHLGCCSSPRSAPGFELPKQNFWDSISLRYGWGISKLLTMCPCGSKFDIRHSMSYFVTIRHNDLRDLTAKIILEVCNDTEIEQKPVSLVEDLSNRTANRSNETKLYVWARCFWKRRQQGIVWFKGVQFQLLPISQQITLAMSRYKR